MKIILMLILICVAVIMTCTMTMVTGNGKGSCTCRQAMRPPIPKSVGEKDNSEMNGMLMGTRSSTPEPPKVPPSIECSKPPKAPSHDHNYIEYIEVGEELQ